MAAYSGTPVINRNYKDATSKYSVFEITLTLAAQGDATDYVGAASLKLSVIKGCSCAVKSTDDVILPCSPNTAGSKLLFGGGASNAPATYTGTFNITVWGLSA